MLTGLASYPRGSSIAGHSEKINWKYKILTVKDTVATRVESRSDDPDYLGHLGHFFGGSSGSHPQTKLSGCELDFNRSHVL